MPQEVVEGSGHLHVGNEIIVDPILVRGHHAFNQSPVPLSQVLPSQLLSRLLVSEAKHMDCHLETELGPQVIEKDGVDVTRF